jgi:NTP pyrophosphatase (non-canonical NTP hydrolase)
MIRDAQARAWANKVAKGFNTTDVPMEFGLLWEEVGEAFSAWRKGRPDLGGELADVAIFLLGLAQMTGVDLAAEVEAKLAVNEARDYARLPNGTLVKQEGAAR